MEYQLYKNITVNPEVCNGKPVIGNTRITVKTIMEHLFAGDNEEEILRSFPSLTKDLAMSKEFTLK